MQSEILVYPPDEMQRGASDAQVANWTAEANKGCAHVVMDADRTTDTEREGTINFYYVHGQLYASAEVLSRDPVWKVRYYGPIDRRTWNDVAMTKDGIPGPSGEKLNYEYSNERKDDEADSAEEQAGDPGYGGISSGEVYDPSNWTGQGKVEADSAEEQAGDEEAKTLVSTSEQSATRPGHSSPGGEQQQRQSTTKTEVRSPDLVEHLTHVIADLNQLKDRLE